MATKAAPKKPARSKVSKEKLAKLEEGEVSAATPAVAAEGPAIAHWSESSFIQKLIETGKQQHSLDSEEISLALHRANESLPPDVPEGTFDDLMKLLESKGIEIADLADDELLMEEDLEFDDLDDEFILEEIDDSEILDHEEL